MDALSRLKLLIVEDDGEARIMLRDIVKSLNVASAHLAADGVEAIQLLEAYKGKINLIIADWQMPGLSGLQLLEHVRQTDTRMPFLMVTGKADIDAVKAAMHRGVSAYIAKPFSRAQIEIKLRVLARNMFRPINVQLRSA